jgi:phage shock protein PspC (stress-responsive transcriptional regulator)
MKKVEKISIADISFTLDKDAYLSLKQYLDSLCEYYENDPDGKEIIADIEARIAELILGEQVYTKVVTRALIDRITAQLGTPQEIEDEGKNPESAAHVSCDSRSVGESGLPRRLHRSAEGRLIGGVSSGFARYFNIGVGWVRIVFLLPLILRVCVAPFDWHGEDFFNGWIWVFFVIYIVLWVALPLAKTPRQRLEARGEKITAESIRQNLQDTVTTPAGRKAASVAAELLTVLGRVMLLIVKFVVAVVGFTLFFAALSVFAAMVGVIFHPSEIMMFDGMSWLKLMEGMKVLSPVLFAEVTLLCVLLPLAVMSMALLSFVFGWRLRRMFYVIALGLWGAAVIVCGIVSLSNVRFLRDVLPERVEQWHDRTDDHHDRHNDHHNNDLDIRVDSLELSEDSSL